MTGGAGVVSRGEVLQSPRRTDLTSLRQSGGVVMTIRAGETLARAVLRVTEGQAERCGRRRCARVRFLIVARFARSKVPSIRLRVRSVAGVTLIVR